MEVPLQSPALLVLRRHQPLPRRPQLLEPLQQLSRQADVLQHQSRLVGEVVDKFVLDWRERFTGSLADAEGAEQLALVSHRDCPVGSFDFRNLLVEHGDGSRHQGP